MSHDRKDTKHNEPQLARELQQFAKDLSQLSPRDDRLDRERLAFLAGRASATPCRAAKVLGLSLESRIWPAAFASMTAVAAGVLFALLVRSEGSGSRALPYGDRIYDSPQLTFEPAYDRGLLSTRDIYRRDVDAVLAKNEAKPAASDALPARAFDTSAPTLTPNSWNQVINETESAQPSPHDASGLIQLQGANS